MAVSGADIIDVENALRRAVEMPGQNIVNQPRPPGQIDRTAGEQRADNAGHVGLIIRPNRSGDIVHQGKEGERRAREADDEVREEGESWDVHAGITIAVTLIHRGGARQGE